MTKHYCDLCGEEIKDNKEISFFHFQKRCVEKNPTKANLGWVVQKDIWECSCCSECSNELISKVQAAYEHSRLLLRRKKAEEELV